MSCFSDKLKELRIDKKKTQRQLAKELNVSQNAVCNWENGNRQPTFEMLEKIASLFGVSVSYLLDNSVTSSAFSYSVNKNNMHDDLDIILNDNKLSDDEKAQKISLLLDQKSQAEDISLENILRLAKSSSCGFIFDTSEKCDPSKNAQIAVIDNFEYRKSLLIADLELLNDQGQEEAVKRVRDLTYNPEYQRKTEASGADRPPAEPPANEGQPPAGADPHQDNNQDNE